MDPKISIIIPFFNSEKTLERAINSVLLQSFTFWELILVNDGSTDKSEEVAQTFLEDPRISYFYQENKGVSSARNLGAKTAMSDWLVFLDSDDELIFDALSSFSKAIQKSQNKMSFVGGIAMVNGEKEVPKLPHSGVYFPKIPGTYCIKKSLFQKVEGFDIKLKFSENTELFHRIGLENASDVLISKIVLRYYDNPKGGSKNLQNAIDSNLLILRKHDSTLSKHTKHLYHQVIGVKQLRFRRFSEARKHLWKSYTLKPYKFSTLGRLLISLFPCLAVRLYSEKVG